MRQEISSCTAQLDSLARILQAIIILRLIPPLIYGKNGLGRDLSHKPLSFKDNLAKVLMDLLTGVLLFVEFGNAVNDGEDKCCGEKPFDEVPSAPAVKGIRVELFVRHG